MSIQCVETLITVRVFPDGKYHMKFRTEGDKEDIFNQDFPIPMSSPWTAEIIEKGKEDSDETVHIIISEAVLSGNTLFHTNINDPAPLRHPIIVQEKNRLFSTEYFLRQVFKGRQVHQKYPLMAIEMQDTGNDSTGTIVETEIIMYCLKAGIEDLQKAMPVSDLLKARILNHFQGVFFKAEEEGKLFGIMDDNQNGKDVPFVLPKQLIETNFRPFLSDLPQNFTEACMNAMNPYIEEANITVNLHDDTFKFSGTLPGAITHTNADSISNDTLWWSFNYEHFLNDDYVIEAASIVYHPNNIQKAIITGALILLIGLILIFKKRHTS